MHQNICQIIFEQKIQLQKIRAEYIFITQEISRETEALEERKTFLDNLKLEHSQIINEIADISQKLNSKRNKRTRDVYSEKMPDSTKRRRQAESFQAVAKITGASNINKQPALDCMFDTFSKKNSNTQFRAHFLKQNQDNKLLITVKQKTLNIWVSSYALSSKCLLQSAFIYYSNNVMGKRKYCSIRKMTRKTLHAGSRLPNYVPWERLSNFLNSIDIGQLLNVHPTLTETAHLSSSDSTEGCYRRLDTYALRLAQYYLTVNATRNDKLIQFENIKRKNPQSMMFAMAIGGDGAPGFIIASIIHIL